MKKNLILAFFLIFSVNALELNQEAPNFELIGEDGKKHQLSDYKGQTIVLEWLNHGCPFIRKHYQSDNMQETQAFAEKLGVKWLSIISSASGKQGHVDVDQARMDKKRNGSKATHVLIDSNGKVGLMYGAKTTPHMFIVNKDGKLVYQGAIDSVASPDPADITGATNYIKKALVDLSEGKKVKIAKTKAYGCSVKY